MINLKKTLLYTLIPASFVCGLSTELIKATDAETSDGTYKTSTYEASIPVGVGFNEYNKGTIEISGTVKAIGNIKNNPIIAIKYFFINLSSLIRQKL